MNAVGGGLVHISDNFCVFLMLDGGREMNQDRENSLGLLWGENTFEKHFKHLLIN